MDVCMYVRTYTLGCKKRRKRRRQVGEGLTVGRSDECIGEKEDKDGKEGRKEGSGGMIYFTAHSHN